MKYKEKKGKKGSALDPGEVIKLHRAGFEHNLLKNCVLTKNELCIDLLLEKVWLP